MQYDVFISHSSQDKDKVARPLAQALQDRGLTVWLDEEQLQVGDSIRRGIDSALRESRFGVVVLSPAYLHSEWGQKELDAFFAKEKYQSKSILPIYHGICVEAVEHHWPMLADKISLSSADERIEQMADKIQISIRHRSSESAKLVTPSNKHSWLNNNWQWGIGLIIVIAALANLLWYNAAPPSDSSASGAISIRGDVSGGTVIANRYQNFSIDSEAAKLIAENLLQNLTAEKDQALEEQVVIIQGLTETIARLQEQPSDKLKQKALDKLKEGKPEEASQLLKHSLYARENALQSQYRQMAEDWVDVGNIAYLNNSQEALDAYTNAVLLDPSYTKARVWQSHIYVRLGRLDDAISTYENLISSGDTDERNLADAYGNLGLIYRTRGNFEESESLQLKALQISEAIPYPEGAAAILGNLGLLYDTFGKQDKAEEFYLKSLKINEDLGYQEGVAVVQGNLGLIYRKRKKLNKAEEFHVKALKVYQELGNQVGMAHQYGNLGLVYGARGELSNAEEFLLLALKIDKTLGRQEGIGLGYANLGELYYKRGELDKGCQHLQASVRIFTTVGSATAHQVQAVIDAKCPELAMKNE